jgi:hypothetical protein
MAPGVIHLKEVSTARTVAKLEDPGGDRPVWMGFVGAGTQLVVSAQYAKAIHVWDLRLIRAQLKSMGLDWDWPEFAPAAEPDNLRPPGPDSPLRIDVIGFEPQAALRPAVAAPRELGQVEEVAAKALQPVEGLTGAGGPTAARRE